MAGAAGRRFVTRRDYLTDVPSKGFAHTDANPAPLFREFCSVDPTSLGRLIETVTVLPGVLT